MACRCVGSHLMKGLLFILLSLSLTSHGQVNSSVVVSKPLKSFLHNHNRSKLSKYLNESKWNALFPNRHGLHKGAVNHKQDFYSFNSFLQAAKLFPAFLSEGDDSTQRRELAAFLANIAQETSGGWADAPGGYFKWGLYYLEENQKSDYADTVNKNYAPVPGKSYFGRGPKQLSWNYNYGQFSEAWYGSKDSLLQHPERLSSDPVLSFASAIWFWMTPQYPKPSCHDVMVGKWKPTEDDLKKGRVPGFGATVNVINGGVECGQGSDMQQTTYRYQYYQYFCRYFKVSPGENVNCGKQIPFGR